MNGRNISTLSSRDFSVTPESPTKFLSKANPKPEYPKGEPSPDWDDAKYIWGAAWPAHWIGYTSLFGLLGIMTVVAIVRIIRAKKGRQRVISKFSLSVTATLLVFSVSRLLYMLIRPYQSNQCLFGAISNCPDFLVVFILSLGLPSLTSAFTLLHLALLDVTKMRLSKFSKLQNWKFLLSLVSLSYILSVTVELINVSYNTIYLITICQTYFIIWSSCLVAAYLYTGLRIATSNRNTLMALNGLQSQMPPEMAKARTKNLRKVMTLTLYTAALGIAYLVCQLYSLVAVYTLNLSLVQNPDPWPWLIYQYFSRSVECCMTGCLLFNVSWKSKRVAKQSQDESHARDQGMAMITLTGSGNAS